MFEEVDSPGLPVQPEARNGVIGQGGEEEEEEGSSTWEGSRDSRLVRKGT